MDVSAPAPPDRGVSSGGSTSLLGQPHLVPSLPVFSMAGIAATSHSSTTPGSRANNIIPLLQEGRKAVVGHNDPSLPIATTSTTTTPCTMLAATTTTSTSTTLPESPSKPPPSSSSSSSPASPPMPLTSSSSSASSLVSEKKTTSTDQTTPPKSPIISKSPPSTMTTVATGPASVPTATTTVNNNNNSTPSTGSFAMTLVSSCPGAVDMKVVSPALSEWKIRLSARTNS
ncbi:uncharacterized protein [Macrobrachium rosenbergii]|uniref:uncharacterized protein isoform X1 n=1 Tax=Macrobrachium rosenbergii TaxID=79674 RepID=UPI0034D6B087